MVDTNGKEAWIVLIPDDTILPNAISAGQNFKKSKTNGISVALISKSVSTEARNELNQVYDMVVVEETAKGVDFALTTFQLKTRALDFRNDVINQKGASKTFDGEDSETGDSRPGIISEDQTNWVAVVGMSCRFPLANSIDEYWELLQNGENTCSTPPGHRTKLVNMDPDIKANFLKCPIDQFDASFFGFSPSEARLTDPQARLLLEVSWEALEDAGLNPDNFQGTKVGVFYGSWLQDYRDALNDTCTQPTHDIIRKYLGNGFGLLLPRFHTFTDGLGQI